MRLKLDTVIDISDTTIGECVLELQSVELWGYPQVVAVDDFTPQDGECVFEENYKTIILRRRQSRKRDIEVKFMWYINAMNATPLIFNGQLPFIADNAIDRVKFQSSIPCK